MTEHVGQVLKALREARRFSLRQLACMAKIDNSTLSNIEAGRRGMSVRLAQACDRALGTSLLTMIVREGDPVNRRTLVSSALGMLAVGAVAPAAAAEALRLGFAASPAGVDYAAKIDDYIQALATQPDGVFGAQLLTDLAGLQQVIKSGRASLEQMRAAALMSNIFGLYQGGIANLTDARGWYSTAIALADQSHDLPSRVWTRGRAASRAVYEGMSVPRVRELAAAALNMSDAPSAGAVEAYSAMVHVHALTGNLVEGRTAVEGMARVADALPMVAAGPHQRVLLFQTYLEGRVGDLPAVTRAHAAAARALRDLPHWRTDTDLYLGLGLVRHGQVEDGLGVALRAVAGAKVVDRVLALGVRDVLYHVPAGYRSDTRDQLAGFASTQRGPWEMIPR